MSTPAVATELDYNFEPFTPDHYSILCAWWHTRDYPVLPLDQIPDPAGILYHLGAPRVFLSAYRDQATSFAMLAWLTAAPSLPPRAAHRYVTAAILHLRKILAELGCTPILADASTPGLTRIYQRLGFQPGDSTVTHLLFVP